MPTKAQVLQQLKNIPDDEPLFLLRGQDKTFPAVVRIWCTLADSMGCFGLKVVQAGMIAHDAQNWQNSNPHRVKVPD